MNQKNLGRATAVALLTAAVLVLPYALIVKGLGRNFSYLSIGLGLGVGYAAQKVGKASGIAIGIVAAVATFAASFIADCLAIKWLVADRFGVDVTLMQARHGLSAISYVIFAIGAFIAFGAAGGRHELRERSSASGAGRFTPDMMTPTTMPPPAVPLSTTPAMPGQTTQAWTPMTTEPPAGDAPTPSAPTT